MQALRVENFQKCVEILEDYHHAVSTQLLDNCGLEMIEKKKQAEFALKHMGTLLGKNDTYRGDIMHCFNCAQDTSA